MAVLLPWELFPILALAGSILVLAGLSELIVMVRISLRPREPFGGLSGPRAPDEEGWGGDGQDPSYPSAEEEEVE